MRLPCVQESFLLLKMGRVGIIAGPFCFGFPSPVRQSAESHIEGTIMKRICLALLFISALLLPMGALAAKNDANTDQIYGVRYGGGTVPAKNDRWLGLTVDSTDATFYIDTHLQKGNYSKASIGKAFVTRDLKKHPENVSSFVIPASASLACRCCRRWRESISRASGAGRTRACRISSGSVRIGGADRGTSDGGRCPGADESEACQLWYHFCLIGSPHSSQTTA